MTKLQTLVNKFKGGKVADHVYQSDGASRDPECRVRGCKWDWNEHLDQELLAVVRQSAEEKR